MSAADEAFISTLAAAVAAVAALAAVVVGTVNVIYARKLLTESRATITELRTLQDDGKGTIDELRKLAAAARAETQAEQETTLALHAILVQSQATRGLELLQEIARQVFIVKAAMEAVRSGGRWLELSDAQLLLGAELAGLSDEELPACRKLTDASTDPRTDTRSADLAATEIRIAIERWQLRLAEVATQANAQLRRLAMASEPDTGSASSTSVKPGAES